MDIYCPICGEPIEVDEIHEIAGDDFAEKLRIFKRIGCNALNMKHNSTPDKDRAELAQLAGEILGDDIDGMAAMLEDAEAFGLFGSDR